MVLSSLEAKVGSEQPSMRSLLQVQAAFSRPMMMISCFTELVDSSGSAAHDEDFLSALYEVVQQLEHRSGWLRDILLEVLSRVAHPWLDSVSAHVGIPSVLDRIQQRHPTSIGFVRIEHDGGAAVRVPLRSHDIALTSLGIGSGKDSLLLAPRGCATKLGSR